MKLIFTLTVALILTCANGCQKHSDTSSDELKTEPVAAKLAAPALKESPAPEEGKDASYWESVNQLYEKAKSSGATTAVSAKEWLTELYGGATSASKTATADTAEWFGEMYKKAKDSGQTTASSAKEWLAEDIESIGTWEYKTLVMDLADAENIETELNKLGSERWECFWVDRQGERKTFYLKKTRRSFVQQIPLRQLLLLIPLLGATASGAND